MSFFTLTLVRHGQTTANKEGILQGQSNTQLSEVGIRQAQLVAERLQNDHFSHIFSSDLDRAAHTAQAIKEKNKVSSCPLVHDKRLRERHFGSLQGQLGKECREMLRATCDDWRPPGGERTKQVQERATSFFDDLCAQMRDSAPEELPSPEPLFPPQEESAAASPSFRDCDIRTIRSSDATEGCPNVSLSPLVEQRFTRFSSVSSGRNSFEDTDYLPPMNEVLVVSHGGWIRELLRVFINDYGCRMNGGNRHALLISPNTGVSRFLVSLEEGSTARITSVFLHDRSHLDADYKTAWDL